VRLKQLRISGFKSFADTTVIEFPGAVAGIVGPNGCGKSNVIDAIRWVLGEARVSELRGSTSMSELIFSGSVNRPASSRASVELVLDNSDGTIKGAWGRYTELSVKRVVTRDGSNAYLINNQQVRRRDVQDIFMGTGLGPRSYAIISQGMISNFIKAKPEELRVYLEEAAGVSKYKDRRRETETALAGTRNNLEKVSYLQETKRTEIERLTAEAEVAARWKELTGQKDTAELLWYFLQEQDAGAAVNKVNAQIAAREADLLQGRGELQKLTTQIDALKEEARVRREAADKAANARVTELEGAIARIITEKDSLAREIANAAESIARRRNERDTALSRLAELAVKEQELRENAEAMTEECAAAQESALELQQECEEKKEAYEKARQDAAAHEKRMEVLNVQMQALTRELNDVEARLEAIEAGAR
jgi:chromosome segregation protein